MRTRINHQKDNDWHTDCFNCIIPTLPLVIYFFYFIFIRQKHHCTKNNFEIWILFIFFFKTHENFTPGIICRHGLFSSFSLNSRFHSERYFYIFFPWAMRLENKKHKKKLNAKNLLREYLPHNLCDEIYCATALQANNSRMNQPLLMQINNTKNSWSQIRSV